MLSKLLTLFSRIGLSLILVLSMAGANNIRTTEIQGSDIHEESGGGTCLGLDDIVRRNESSGIGRAVVQGGKLLRKGIAAGAKSRQLFAAGSGHLLSGHRLWNGFLAPPRT